MYLIFAKVLTTLLSLIPIIVSTAPPSPSLHSDMVEAITTYPSWYIGSNISDSPGPTKTPTLYRMDGAFYPASLIGPVTHGPEPQFVKETTLKLNGEVYNIKESGRLGRGDGGDVAGFGDDNSFPGGDDDTTPAPVQGAIDYVLLPLIFLAIAGPMFVIVFIVMASIEYKLPQNVQLKEKRSLNNRKHTYFNLYTVYNQGAKPFMELVGRTLEQESCQKRVACEVGAFAQTVRNKSPSLFDYAESFTRMLVPSRFVNSYETYFASAKKDVNCLSFTCFTNK